MKLIFSTEQFFRHLNFKDSEEQRLAHLIFQLLRLFFLTIVFVSLGMWFFAPSVRGQIAVLVIYLPLLIWLFVRLHQGNVRFVSWWYVASLWTLLSILVLWFEGIRSPAYYSYVIVIVLAGLLLNKQAENIFLILSILIGTISFLIEYLQILPIPFSSSTLVPSWIGVSVSIVLLSILIQQATDGWRKTAKQQREQAAQNLLLREQAEQQAAALQQANQQLKELDHLKTKFIRDMTHELRTPLTNLRLYLDLWEMAPEEKKSSYLETLKQQNRRLTHLMDAVSRVTRLDAGVDTSKTELIDLNHLVRRVADANEPIIQKKGLNLRLDLQEDLDAFLGVSSLILELVDHLVSNAVLYSSQGEIKVRTFQQDGESVSLQVADEGIGIAEHEHQRIFDRFYRADNVGELAIAGAGLGLTIVKRIVNLHKGHVKIESELDRGSVFTICLPLNFRAS